MYVGTQKSAALKFAVVQIDAHWRPQPCRLFAQHEQLAHAETGTRKELLLKLVN